MLSRQRGTVRQFLLADRRRARRGAAVTGILLLLHTTYGQGRIQDFVWWGAGRAPKPVPNRDGAWGEVSPVLLWSSLNLTEDKHYTVQCTGPGLYKFYANQLHKCKRLQCFHVFGNRLQLNTLYVFDVWTKQWCISVMGKSQIKSQIIKSNPNNFRSKSNKITNQFHRNVNFLKMFSLHNNYWVSS